MEANVGGADISAHVQNSSMGGASTLQGAGGYYTGRVCGEQGQGWLLFQGRS